MNDYSKPKDHAPVQACDIVGHIQAILRFSSSLDIF